MLRYKDFIRESVQDKNAILADHQFDFLGHLMASHDDHKTINESVISEVTLLDTRNKPAASGSSNAPSTANHGGILGPVNMLTHPAVRGNHPTQNADEVGRYKSLMARGHAIASYVAEKSGGVHKHVSNGFSSYMSGVGSGHNSWEDPRKTQKDQLKGSQELLKSHYRDVGYKASSAPSWLAGNTKTEKNEKLGDITAGLSLAPARSSNIGKHTSCAKATAGCENSCLGHSTGKNALLSNINSKVAKHQFFVQHPEHAARMIHAELLDHVDNVHKWNQERAKTGEKPLEASYRANVVTDFNHPKMSADMINHVSDYANKKGVKFTVRDYTKHAERLYQPRPANYHLALSHTGTGHSESNDKDVSEALNRGHTVAAVIHGNATHFYDHKTGRHYPIDDGDADDRIEDGHKNVGHTVHSDGTGSNPKTGQKEGVIRALRIKGSSNAVKEAAGDFVSKTTENFVHPKTGEKMNVVEINKPKP